jgi:tRNA dimethylallyltransferase
MPETRPTVLIVGPTAGGKTSLAIELAQRLAGGGECVCCDSMQVYRGMDIGTAKPAAAERARAPHHLLDIVEPSDDSFSVDQWLALAQSAISQIRSRGKWPIVVGGTNLYVQAFLNGLADMPPPSAELRAALESASTEELRSKLECVDPAAAQRIHVNDRKRTIRAIEVYEQTGSTLSSMQTQWNRRQAPMEESPIVVGLEHSVAVINRRINQRVREMVDAGLLDEVRTLLTQNALGRNARGALGYKQLIEFLEHRCTLAEAVEQIKIRTRQFAKQQRSWLRRFRSHGRSAWIPADEIDAQTLANQALAAIRQLTQQPVPNAISNPGASAHRLDKRELTA